MIENMHLNKAFLFAKKNNKENQFDLLDSLKEKFKKYRKDWNDQPKACIKNKDLSEEMKGSKKIPLCIDIEVAAVCDLACPFCFREFTVTPDKIIDEKLCYNLIDQSAEMKVPSMKFNWRGEPLLNPKLPDYINYAKQKGILETIINTNATHLNKENGKKLINAGLDMLIYSFDGGTKETYEKMRPGRFKKNDFENVYNNIKNFSKIKKKLKSKFPYTKIQMILTEDTMNEKESFFNLFSDFVDDVSLSQYTDRGGDLNDLDKNDKEQYNKKIQEHNLPNGSNYMKDVFGNISVSKGRLPCEQPFQRLLVTYEGRVAMCCYDWGAAHPVGYVDKKTFFNNKDYDEILKKVKDKKRGFELLSQVKKQKQLNNPLKKIQNLSQIWFGNEIDNVRQKHIEGKSTEIEVCKNCSFKDVYDWVK
jgi:MoaA/NifB/PqqE/SkfB family radical SAM enzyme